MRLAVLVGTLLLAPAASGATSGGLDIAVSSSRAGARPVRVSLTLHTRLQCGSAAGIWQVALPGTEQTPRVIDPTDVLVNRHAAVKVNVAANLITVTVPRQGLLCDIVAPGKVTIVFTSAAKLGNPTRGGSYVVTVRRARVAVRGTLRIR